jgi:hypothetical protein
MGANGRELRADADWALTDLAGSDDARIPLRRIAEIAGVGEDLADRSRDLDDFPEANHCRMAAGRRAAGGEGLLWPMIDARAINSWSNAIEAVPETP